MRKSFAVIMTLLLFFGNVLPAMPSISIQTESAYGLLSAGGIRKDGSITIDFESASVPQAMRPAITSAVISRPASMLPGRSFAIVSLRLEDDWALATLAVIDNHPDGVGMASNGALILLRGNSAGAWEVALEGTPTFAQLLSATPDNVLDHAAKEAFQQSGLKPQSPLYAILKFPWDSSQQWTLTKGWHEGNYVDFAPDRSEPNKWVLAAHEGTVTRICIVGTVSANVQVQYSDGITTTTTEYWHLDKNSILGLILGKYVFRGQVLGRAYNDGFDWDGCGISSGPHVHFRLPSQDVTVDDWTAHSDNTWTKDIETKRPGDKFSSTNILVVRQLKYIDNPWPWSWKYQIGSDNNKIKKVVLNSQPFLELPGCSWGTKWLNPGTHLLEYWVQPSGADTPTPVVQPWPYIKVVCAADDGGDPAGNPGSSTDNASFLSDITLPDGTVVSSSQALVKTWRLKNTGSTTWGNGYQLVFVNGDQMGAPGAVNVLSTAPNATTDISINLTAPTSGGDHTGYWRLRNPQGTYFGPTIWVRLNVLTPNPGSGRITLFDVSPASPSAATLVHVVGRVRWFPEFRSMRFVLGNEVQEMTNFRQVGDQLEISADWNTAILARGNYALALEVATQGDPGWVTPERQVKTYTLSGTPAPMNRAPNRPSLTSPYDWYVYYSGNTATLCAQAEGDPDGDAIAGYYFDIFDSAQLWNSGWTGSNCVTTSALGPYSYQWRVKVRDGSGAESGWSEPRHFTLVNPNLSISELYFVPLDGNSEQVKIRACTTGQGGIGITMRVSVNDANDGSGNGAWHIIKELGVPCFNDIDAPIWNTLEYGDGPHRVRVEAHGTNTGWDGAAVREEVYTLPHRRPASTRLIVPIPPSENIREAIYLNTRTITFRWESTIRAISHTLHIGTNSSPKDDPNPVFRQTFGSGVTEHTVTFSQDYSTLYWQVSATNDAGINASSDQLLGIDRVAPSCTVQPLAAATYESVFQVSWDGSDNLAGIRTFDMQYLDSGRGTWNDWLTNVSVTKTYELFAGQSGHTYSFRCLATDNANNTGNYPPNADTFITVDPAARPPTPWWNSAYTGKRNLTILNNMPGTTLPVGYPIHLHFDSTTTPTADEIYNASQSSPKCNDLRIIYNDAIELDRVVQNCASSAIDIWFRTQISIPGGSSNSTAHQLYYGNAGTGSPPADERSVWPPLNDANTVGLWYLSEGAGTAVADASGYNNNGTSLGAMYWTTGKFGPALANDSLLSGAGGVSVPGNASLSSSAFTFEAFVRRNAQAYGSIAGQGREGQTRERWILRFQGDSLKLTVWPWAGAGAGEVFSSNNFLPDTNWHHVAVTFDGSQTAKFYRDGALIDTRTFNNSGISNVNYDFFFGSSFEANVEKINGAIDQVRFSNIARTSFPYGAFATITNEPTLATGTPIAPPTAGSPDLAVLSLNTYPNPGGGTLVQAVIQNQGNLNAQNGFYTDLYLNNVPTGAGYYTGTIQFWVNDPIAAGATVTLTTVITDLPGLSGAGLQRIGSVSETSGTLFVQVDSTGVVSETDNLNNIYTPGTEICVASPDAYEGDDSAGTAKLISVGQTQTHNFGGPGDRDWVTFTAQGGMTYTLRTFNLGLSADTYLYLYDTDGTTLLASNDDYGGGLASWIDWTAPATGTYYLAAQHWNPNVGGCGTMYDLAVTRALTNKVFLPIVFKNH